MMKYYAPNGKAIRESTGETDRRKAQKVADAKETDKGRGLPVAAGVGKILFGTISVAADPVKHIKEQAATGAVALFESDYRNNEQSSLEDQQRRLRLHLIPIFGGYRMTEIGPSEIAAYITQRREEGAKVGTVNRETDIIRRMFTLCVQGGLLLYQPHVPRLRGEKARAGFFERGSFESVYCHLPEALQPVVAFANITGWRIDSEVLTRQWRHVDIEANEVRLDPGETKNGEPRVFPLTADLRALLLERLAVRNAALEAGHVCPWVFFRMVAKGRGGKKYPKVIKRFDKAWAAACKAAGCPGRLRHDFRRTAIRTMVRRGVPERVAMQLSGHLTRSVFERYNIVSAGDLTDAASRLEGQAPPPAVTALETPTGTQTGTQEAQTGTDGQSPVKKVRKFGGAARI